MNRISREKRRIILQSLVEGASIRSTARIANVAINTVIRLLIHAGDVCDEYSDHMLRNLQCERLELDEVWCFCYAKNANVPFAKAAPEIAGDVWTWVAIDPDTKLVPCWMVGERDGHVAWEFLQEIKARMAFGHRLQITTDGWKSYKSAIPAAFKDSADHAVLNKKIIRGYDSDSYPDHRYSQRQRYFITKEAVRGNPDMDKAVTSHIEREFLNLRMGI